jgi:hypothetical protein
MVSPKTLKNPRLTRSVGAPSRLLRIVAFPKAGMSGLIRDVLIELCVVF